VKNRFAASCAVAVTVCVALTGCGAALSSQSQPSSRVSTVTPEATQPPAPHGTLPASKLEWAGFFASDHADPKVVYTLLGAGFLRTETSNKVGAVITTWLKAHPDANVVPVIDFGAGPDGSRIMWAWIVDGDQYLNHELVRQGVCAAGTMRRPDDSLRLLITLGQYEAFAQPLAVLEASAKQHRLGIWK
jgi:hypothetical protein